MLEELRIKMKKGSQEPGPSAPADVCPATCIPCPSAFGVGDCWRLSAIVGDCWRYFFTGHPDPLSLKSNQIKPNQTKSNQIKPKIKKLVVYQPDSNIPGTAPTAPPSLRRICHGPRKETVHFRSAGLWPAARCQQNQA
jgi:hypothetical protein